MRQISDLNRLLILLKLRTAAIVWESTFMRTCCSVLITFATDRVPTKAAITLLDSTSRAPSGTPDSIVGASKGEVALFGGILKVSALAAPAMPGRINGPGGGWMADDVSTTIGVASSSAKKAPTLYDWISFITSSGTSDSGTPCDSHKSRLNAGPNMFQLWMGENSNNLCILKTLS